jgi:phosphodiester glycosidase
MRPIAVRELQLPRPDRPRHLRRLRVALADGRRTTVHVASYDARRTEPRVVLVRGQQLAAWCAAQGIREALVGGFFTRPDGEPLGELRTAGVLRRHVPFAAPWHAERACVHVDAGTVAIARRHELPGQPRGDLLQAGPLLVAGGRVVYDRSSDPEGFSAAAHQFDSDITAARHPRAALALAGGRLLAIACDGRSRSDAGLTLEELAAVCRDLGAERALNLDGGGSTTLVAGGRLRNRPRAAYGVPEPGGRGVATALVFGHR